MQSDQFTISYSTDKIVTLLEKNGMMRKVGKAGS